MLRGLQNCLELFVYKDTKKEQGKIQRYSYFYTANTHQWEKSEKQKITKAIDFLKGIMTVICNGNNYQAKIIIVIIIRQKLCASTIHGTRL